MQESNRARGRSRHATTRSTSRREFMRRATLYSLATLAGAGLLGGFQSPPATPTFAPTTTPPPQPSPSPVAAGSATLQQALKDRKSASGFLAQPVPRPKILELLWAAWGINRPDSGKRTAPSAMNAQEIDLYMLTAEGAFLYDAKANGLTPVSEQDLRAKATSAGSLKDAAVQIVFVADYAKLRGSSQSQKELWSAAHAGFIGQNIYLFCAAEGLGARFYAGIDKTALQASLALREGQAVIFGQAVGYARG